MSTIETVYSRPDFFFLCKNVSEDLQGQMDVYYKRTSATIKINLLINY